jgi:Xaa-Pro aminopeptidase
MAGRVAVSPASVRYGHRLSWTGDDARAGGAVGVMVGIVGGILGQYTASGGEKRQAVRRAWTTLGLPPVPPSEDHRSMRHLPIPAKLFRHNRAQLARRMRKNSVAIVQANDIQPTATDGTAPYYPNDDLFYLSGIEQEHSILMMAPDSAEPRRRCVLFLREPNALLKIWEGDKHSREEARAISGIDEIRWLGDFPVQLRIAMCEAEHVYLASNEHSRAVIEGETRDLRFARDLQRQFPLHDYQRLARIMHELRAVKSPAEVALIRQACAITRQGFLRVLGMVRPGVNECEVEAEYACEFIRNRGRMAYNPIIASGANSCVLHYNRNDQPCRDGDVLLLDVASSYANYNADLTRTIPVGGRFSKRQRKVYDAVLRTVRAMTRAAVPGKLTRDWQKECEALVTEELLELGLLTSKEVKGQDPANPACKKYFMHGCGHPLGLGVHDAAFTDRPFAPGWVLTIEPGIYIAEEGFGIRLENDILVTRGRGGAIDLMADTPIEAEEIEELMHRGGNGRGGGRRAAKKPASSSRR